MNYDDLNALKATRDHERRVEECISTATEFCRWYGSAQEAINDAGLLARFKPWRKNKTWLLRERGHWLTLVKAGSKPNTPPVNIAYLVEKPWRPLVNPVFVYNPITDLLHFFDREQHWPQLMK